MELEWDYDFLESTKLQHVGHKLIRAKQHIMACEQVVKDWGDTGGIAITSVPQAENWVEIKVTSIKPFPDEFPLAIGEFSHQIRSALDHIMFLICKPATEKEKKSVYFPLLDSADKFNAAGIWKKIPSIPNEIKAAIETIQPYSNREDIDTHFLSKVQTINNWDKHRRAVVGVAGYAGADSRIKVSKGIRITSTAHCSRLGEIETGSIISSFQHTGIPTGGKIEVQEAGVVFYPFLKEPGVSVSAPPEGITLTMQNALKCMVKTVIPKLRPFI